MSAKKESPKIEMQRKLREIAGAARAGEKDDQLRARAVRHMNAELVPDRQIGESRGKRYWYAEIEDVPSDHMDRVRELAFVHPLQEAQDAVERAEQHLESLRQRLVGASRAPGGRIGPGHVEADTRRPEGLEASRARLPSGFQAPLTQSLSMT